MKKTTIDRRRFLQLSSMGTGSLLIGFVLPSQAQAMLPDDCEYFQPNTLIKIDKSGTITIYVARQEMGQGVNTSLPMIVADEMDADWKKVKTEIAPYGALAPGAHDTGGSQSVLTDYNELRKAGAIAKTMLITAAAKKWGIAPEMCAADNGTVVNTTTMKSIGYGELVCDAAKLPIPEKVTLKQAKDFKLIGKEQKKSNLKEILTGKAKYGIDLKIPGMVFASIERCPVLGGSLVKVDDTAAKAIPGYLKYVTIKGTGVPMHVRDGVAVIATSTWAAQKAKAQLKIEWSIPKDKQQNSADLFKQMAVVAKQKPKFEKFKKGNIDSLKKDPLRSLRQTYSEPFLAHATMEPINFIAQVKDGNCELWGGLQLPDWTVNQIAADCGIKKENIKVNLALIGGGFGRRLHFEFAIEAVKVAQQLNQAVKIVWDRTEDIRFDPFRPANYHLLEASWDAKGNMESWYHHLLSTSIAVMTGGPSVPDPSENLGGATGDFYYDVPNVKTGYTHVDFNINRGWLRSVEICMNVFPIESFIDEVARKQKKDPLKFRLGLLENRPMFLVGEGAGAMKQYPSRIANVLKAAAEGIGYNKPRKPKHYIGVATHSFIFAKSYAAHAIEIEMVGPKQFKIVKVVVAIDCGIVINPDGLKNQMEGGLAFALQQTLKGEITIKDGRVVQDSFRNYELLRYNEMPPVEIIVVPSEEEPGGVGEVGLPTVAPALCNALAAAGARPRTLPIRNEGFVLVTGTA